MIRSSAKVINSLVQIISGERLKENFHLCIPEIGGITLLTGL
jgi:hypothetical protein